MLGIVLLSRLLDFATEDEPRPLEGKMSFVLAERTRSALEGSTFHGIQIYGDTKVELDGAVRLNWPSITRRAVGRYGICKIAIPCPTLCVAFAGNNLWHVDELFSWMAENSPFEVSALISRAYEIHLDARSRDDIEFLICETDTDDTGRIVCIKNGEVLDDQISAWIGSPIAFRELQEMRMNLLERESGHTPSVFSIFDEVIHSSSDDSVGGFTINVALRDGEFHFNDYLCSHVYKERTVKPGEAIRLFDSREDGGYTIEAGEMDGCPALSFPQTGKTVLYTNRWRYPDVTQSSVGLSHFYLPMLLESDSLVCVEP